mgnify:CR=1 FL=1
MPNYLVVTPQYEERISILDDGTGPIEMVRDTCEVIAKNMREARVLAVHTWRQQHRYWVEDQMSNGASPFTGLRVFNMDLPDRDF